MKRGVHNIAFWPNFAFQVDLVDKKILKIKHSTDGLFRRGSWTSEKRTSVRNQRRAYFNSISQFRCLLLTVRDATRMFLDENFDLDASEVMMAISREVSHVASEKGQRIEQNSLAKYV